MFCDIYCKIYTDCYDYLFGDNKSSDDLYNHLASDANMAMDNSGNPILGDKNIWYLGCNEKFGNIVIKLDDGSEFDVSWGYGESSFQNVRDMLTFCNTHGIFTKEQSSHLLSLIEEGEKINGMYEISNYLVAKRDNIKWEIPESTMREDFIKYMGNVTALDD